jgi:general secretion pathway protein E
MMQDTSEQDIPNSTNLEQTNAPIDVPSNLVIPRLPFSFAKRFGIVLENRPTGFVAAHKEGLLPHVLLEVQRFLGEHYSLETVSDSDFERILGQVYQTDSSGAMGMVEGLGDEMDLASLADSVPETEDLLEQEDDAPIIRLINALLTEAVKDSASDIHIETY